MVAVSCLWCQFVSISHTLDWTAPNKAAGAQFNTSSMHWHRIPRRHMWVLFMKGCELNRLHRSEVIHSILNMLTYTSPVTLFRWTCHVYSYNCSQRSFDFLFFFYYLKNKIPHDIFTMFVFSINISLRGSQTTLCLSPTYAHISWILHVVQEEKQTEWNYLLRLHVQMSTHKHTWGRLLQACLQM